MRNSKNIIIYFYSIMFSFLLDYIENKKKPEKIIYENEKDIFQLPIYYLENKEKLLHNIKTDLELLDSSNNSLYNNILSSDERPSTKLINKWSEYYTTNTNFLRDNQYFLKNYKKQENKQGHSSDDYYTNINNLEKILLELKNETGFYEKYHYIEIDKFKCFNKSALVLQGLTLYNLTSPALSLLIPIIMLILPFFILKAQQQSITIDKYIASLIVIFKNHILGQMIIKFKNADMGQKLFLLCSFGFYFFSIYQNIKSCYQFYKSIYKIKNYLKQIIYFIDSSITNIQTINTYSKKSFSNFINKNNTIKNTLIIFKTDLLKIDFVKFKITDFAKVGQILKCFYELYENADYQNALYYSIDLHYYLLNIENIQSHINTKKLNFCKFTTNKTTFTNAFFAGLIKESPFPVTNNCCLDKNILITGPNAAGKTTILKTTLFNIILSQQLGLGCYKKANINVYKYINSYLNIPDTSQRDSLFQAEARRCKEILDCLVNNKNVKDRHFCIFDELYSGTNPSEAIASAYSFLDFISKYKNLNFLLTTHYISLCNLLENNNNIVNKHMEIINNKNTYKLISGISNIKGGIKVLEDLNYNKTIIDGAKTIICEINL
jgi:hypothetical protein